MDLLFGLEQEESPGPYQDRWTGGGRGWQKHIQYCNITTRNAGKSVDRGKMQYDKKGHGPPLEVILLVNNWLWTAVGSGHISRSVLSLISENFVQRSSDV